MTKTKYVTYLRVSNDKSGGVRGLGIEAQRSAVTQHVRDAVLVAEYIEIESGKRATNRPQLHAALRHARTTGATLLIARLDRLSRNVAFVATLMESGVKFIAADMPTANNLTMHIMSAMAQHEREMISARTTAALAAKRERLLAGQDVTKAGLSRLGNPYGARALVNGGRAAGNAVIAARALTHAHEVLPIIAGIKGAGALTLREIAAELNARGILTARGATWHPTTVKNVLDRAA